MQLRRNLIDTNNADGDVKLAIKGNKEAFVRLMEEHNNSMYRVAHGILKNEEDIEDAYQNTIIKCYNGISKLRREEYFKTWLIRILINECYLILKTKEKTVAMEELNFSEEINNEFASLEVTNAVNNLEDSLRVTTILFYFEDLPQKDIAKILGIPEGTVRSRLSRARSKLYEVLKER